MLAFSSKRKALISLFMNQEKECKNCEEVKVAELSERVAKLEKTVEKQGQQDKQTKLLSKVIF
jgi:hypothetical protein